MSNEVRFAVVSDRAITRMGVLAALSGKFEVHVIVEARNMVEAGSILEHAVDAVVVDADLFRRHFNMSADNESALVSHASADGNFQNAIESLRDQVMERLADLTKREREVLTLLGHGLSNRSMANSLGLSERTVKVHVGRVLTKLAVESRLQAGLAALIHQLTDSPLLLDRRSK